MSRVVVIGAGFAGLAAAIRLAASGHGVTLVEREPVAGGKARNAPVDGARVDLGPTVLSDLGPLRELCADAGTGLDDLVTLRTPAPSFVATFGRGRRIEWHPDPTQTASAMARLGAEAPADWARFLVVGARARRLMAHYLTRGDVAGPGDLVRFVTGGRPGLRDVGPFVRHPTLAGLLDATVRTPDLRRLLAHFARFVGLSAAGAPSVVAVIPYLLATTPVAHPCGGFTALAAALLRLASKLGVEVATGSDVVRLDVARGRLHAVVTGGGDRLACDAAVGAVDVATVAGWLPPGALGRRAGRRAPAMSAWVAWWLVAGEPPVRVHHAFHFDGQGEPLYVALPTVTDPDLAPRGTSIVHALVHVPAGRPVDPAFGPAARARLEAAGWWPGGPVLGHGTTGGESSCYGSAIGPGLLGSLRPSQRVPGVANLVLAGGSVFPGPGIAGVIRSGRRAAALVAAALA